MIMYARLNVILHLLKRRGYLGTPKRDALFVLALLLSIGLIHALLIGAIEDWPLGDALWFTATAGTTVGFGDLSPASAWGRLTTVLFIYIPAIPAVGYMTSLIIDYIIDKRERKRSGQVRLKMKDHIVFINYPSHDGERYFNQVLDELYASQTEYRDVQVVIVSDNLPHGLPQSLVDRNVRYVNGAPNDSATLERAAVSQARMINVLSRDSGGYSDSLVFDICHLLLSTENVQGRRILAETYDKLVESRLKTIGIDAVIKPIRAYPELLVRAIISPGAEKVIEALWDSGGEECLRLERPVDGRRWAEVVSDYVTKDIGTPVAIEDQAGNLRVDLTGSEVISARAVYIIVPKRNYPAFAALRESLA